MSTFAFLDVAARQAQALDDAAHRPWPLPETKWSQAQTHEDVLVASWRVGHDELARVVPPSLPLDTHEGEGWISTVAFRLTNVRLRGLPPVPGLEFGQLDIRTYVVLDDRPGIWVCSLDASSRLLAEAAKRVHRLPAYAADVSVSSGSVQVTRDDLAFEVSFRVTSGPFTPAPGSLEHFLTERYCLYTADGGRLYRAELHHPRWQLARADATVERASIAPVALDGDPHVVYSALQDVLVWPLEEL